MISSELFLTHNQGKERKRKRERERKWEECDFCEWSKNR